MKYRFKDEVYVTIDDISNQVICLLKKVQDMNNTNYELFDYLKMLSEKGIIGVYTIGRFEYEFYKETEIIGSIDKIFCIYKRMYHVFMDSQRDIRPFCLKDVNELFQVSPIIMKNNYVIYFLCKKNEIVYVGQSSNFYYRLINHITSDRKFDNIFFFSCSKKKLTEYEYALISYLKPKYNKYVPELTNHRKEIASKILNSNMVESN